MTMQNKKPAKKRRGDYVSHIPPEEAHPCQIDGCAEPGAYKAPKSREELHEYRWFCLEHVREHNKQWDYFAGLGAEEIEEFIRDAVTGHRPTWDRANLNSGHIHEHYFKLHDALYEFLSGSQKPVAPSPPLTAKLRKALAAMDIDYPYTEQELKVRYRVMVKKYHPDVNKGDKKSEETFKQITAAYHYLSEYIKNLSS